VKPPTDHIFEQTPETLTAWCVSRGMPKFRGGQILEWVYEKGVIDPTLMTNLSKRERDVLAAEMTFLSGAIVAHKKASDGVQKLLLQWHDADASQAAASSGDAGDGLSLEVLGATGVATADFGRQTECVMIPALPDSEDEGRRTACISSQIGCPVGCKFCASGLGGLDGNLSAGRIVEQVWRLRVALRETEGSPDGKFPRITNVVFMGMGEPLANFGPVTAAIRTLNALWGMAISARKITISTVGLPAAIERLADEFELPVTLALSLHAPTDDIRRGLIPWAEYTSIDALLAACQKWFDKTGREITLEYTLLRGINDRPEHAEELSRLARTLRANVNIIRYNEVAGLPFQRPLDQDVRAFQGVLRERRINSHIRASRGRDIAAACGQLRHEAKAAK